MTLLEKIKFAFSKEQELLRKERSAIRLNELKKLLSTHKKEFLFTALFSLGIGTCVSNLAASFTIDKLRKNKFDNESIIACFYNKSCNQKIIHLDIKNDNQKVIDIATAYQFKDDLTKYPDWYNKASPAMKQKMDKYLELTH